MWKHSQLTVLPWFISVIGQKIPKCIRHRLISLKTPIEQEEDMFVKSIQELEKRVI